LDRARECENGTATDEVFKEQANVLGQQLIVANFVDKFGLYFAPSIILKR
jgi:hypothetical protein